jgi:hypothetical protein
MITDRDELIVALELMALQYLEDINGEMNHQFMAAGEICLEILEDEGLVEGSEPIYRFTKKSNYYRRVRGEKR